ncbi:MAG TPA: hypothetical protein VMB50_02935 [Myxococcales bacterium]|nr:hypothetical protein [Myxococcales bacterium]
MIAASCLLLALGVHFPPATEAELQELYGPAQLALVRQADRVEALRLTGEFDADPKSPHRGVERWLTKSRPVSLTPRQARRAVTLVTARASFSMTQSHCDFLPGVLLRFWRGDRHVDVLLCFHCGDVAVILPEAEWPKEVMGLAEPWDYERRLGLMPGFDSLLALSRDIFPGDPELRRVKRPF